MEITIDGSKMNVSEESPNIVEAAKENGIGIPAPCYQSKNSGGCCKACVVEIEGNQRYACGTKPVEGMDITVNRQDLKLLRKQRIAEYKTNPAADCDCDCSCNSGSDCC